ncbi:MAG: hypothetical protein KAY32_09935 [Candidatus Eisenbacteria sp.]|nr:hypothetical protein [Candidatus Eisenbacteria bacterium]
MNDVADGSNPQSGQRHRDLAAGRWRELSLCGQMGHVGSEVSRALNWRTRNPKIAEGAIERALELLDLTLADPRHLRRPARMREIARAREVLLDFLVGENRYGSTGASLQRYFDAFAHAAARGK